MLRLAAISFSAEAISSACARLSIWQGPAISASGKALPKRALRTSTVALGRSEASIGRTMAAPGGGVNSGGNSGGQRSSPLERQRCAQAYIRTDDDTAHAAGTCDGFGAQQLRHSIEIAHRKAQRGEPRAAFCRRWLGAEAVAERVGLHHLDFAARRLHAQARRGREQIALAGEGFEENVMVAGIV